MRLKLDGRMASRTKENRQTHANFTCVWSMGKIVWNSMKRITIVSPPTNPDLADILGRPDVDFENFWRFPGSQISIFPVSQIYRFLDFQTPRFLDLKIFRFQNSQIPRFTDAAGDATRWACHQCKTDWRRHAHRHKYTKASHSNSTASCQECRLSCKLWGSNSRAVACSGS